MGAAGLALTGATIYTDPTREAVADGVVVIQGEGIAAVGTRGHVEIPQNIPTLDCSGLTITAGLWNSHVHFFERKWANAAAIPAAELERQLRDMLTRYGFTSVFDLSSLWENTRALRGRIESGEVCGPRIRSTGEGLIPPGGMPSETVVRMMGTMPVALPEVADAGQASAAAGKLLDAGVDAIKLFASTQAGVKLSEGAMEAAVNAAHRVGRPVFVHPNSAADVAAAVGAGVDVIGHTTPSSGPWDETLVTAMAERGVALTPTLTLWKHFLRHDRASVQDHVVGAAMGQLRAWLDAGGEILFGTDLGAVEYDPGDEYALMAHAGMSFRQILASLTTVPAARFGEGARTGQVAPGFQADLAVFAGDPSRDIRALTAVHYTLRAGKIIYRAGA